MKKSLWALACGGFGIGLTEFVVMGLLPDVAAGMGVSIPRAGLVISAYALGVVIGAPTFTILLGRLAPHRALLALMGVFTVANALSGVAPNFWALVFCRFLSGLPHGAYFGIGAVVASRLADSGKAASAVSVMLGGLTLANVFGVPLATWIGHQLSWRWAFAMVGAVGCVTLLLLDRWVPALAKPAAPNVRADLRALARADLWIAILLPSVGFAGFFAWISYIAPLLIHEAGFDPASIPLLMVLAGVGMTIGNFAGGRLADRFSPLDTAIGLMMALSLILCLNGTFAAHAWILAGLIVGTGAVAMGLGSPIQILLMSYSGGAEMLGASLGQAAFNVGNALGAALGAVPLTLGYSYASPQWVGAGLSFCGVLVGLGLRARLGRRARRDP